MWRYWGWAEPLLLGRSEGVTKIGNILQLNSFF